MGKETKIGLGVIVLLLAVFGGVLFMRLRGAEKEGVPLTEKVKLTSGPSKEKPKFSGGPSKPAASIAREPAGTPATTVANGASSRNEGGAEWSKAAANHHQLKEHVNHGAVASSDTANQPGASTSVGDASTGGRYSNRYSVAVEPAPVPSSPSQAVPAATASDANSAYDPFQRSTTPAGAQAAVQDRDPMHAPARLERPLIADPLPITENRQGPVQAAQTVEEPAANPLRHPSQSPSAPMDERWRENAGLKALPEHVQSPSTGTGANGSRNFTPGRYDAYATSNSGPTPAQAPSGAGVMAQESGPQFGAPNHPGTASHRSVQTHDPYLVQPSATASGTAVNGPAHLGVQAQDPYAKHSAATEWTQGNKPVQHTADSYVVQPNDNYWTISEKVYGTGAYFKALHEHNRHKYPEAEQIRVGDVVATPAPSILQKSYPDLSPKSHQPAASQPPSTGYAATSGGKRAYMVREGDTLFDIARNQLGKASRWAEIYELNRDQLGKDFDFLTPGMELTMPNDGSQHERSLNPLTARPTDIYRR